MTDLGRALLRALIDNPEFIPLYLAGLWFVVLRPILRMREQSRLQQTTTNQVGIESPPSLAASPKEAAQLASKRDLASELAVLFTQTYDTYKSGALNAFKSDFQEWASQHSTTNVRDLYAAAMPALYMAFKDTPPTADEALICAEAQFDTRGFVLTTHHLMWYGVQQNWIGSEPYSKRVALSSVVRCEAKRLNSFRLTLRTGEQVDVQYLSTSLPREYVLYLMRTQTSAAT